MKFDDILHLLGEFGVYQKRLFLLVCLPGISAGSFMMMVIIVLTTPQHRCKIPGLANDTFSVQDDNHRMLINQTIPDSDDPLHPYDRCYVYTSDDVIYDDNNLPVNASTRHCDDWVYDKTVFYSTFTSRENLVCKDALSTSHAQMIFYFGVLVGDLIFGLVADRFGRKVGLYSAILLLIASSFGVVWAPNYPVFVVLQFLIGGACHGAFLIVAVIGLELVGPNKRVWTGVLVQFMFAIGLIYLTGVAYFIRDWSYIQLAVAIPCVLYLPYWWLVPESPRWLISQGRKEEAEIFIHKAAKVNKKELPNNLLDERTLGDQQVQSGNLLHLFSRPVLLKRTLIIFFNWMIVSMTYYGVTMNAGNLGGNFYLNFFLFSLAEFPGYGISIMLLDRLGRKKMHCLSMCIGGTACLCTIFTVLFGDDSLQPLTLTLALIGKIGASAAFAIIYVFSAELYPTVVRNAGMGASSCAARIGGMVAPYIAKSGELIGGKFGKAEPLVVFGALSVLAGLMCLLLPETLNQVLPETIKDGEEFGRSSPRSRKKDVYEVDLKPEDFLLNGTKKQTTA